MLSLFTLLLLGACQKSDMNEPGELNFDEPMGSIRYKERVFQDAAATKEVVYGNSVTQGGVQQDLLMNIYEPANDAVNNRPLIILAHGGGFAEGAKEDFDQLAEWFAKAGYVAATISYRLMDGNDPNLKIAVVDAMHDMKAAVRFFTQNNTYRIDANNIFIGGFSAGAVTALHYANFGMNE